MGRGGGAANAVIAGTTLLNFGNLQLFLYVKVQEFSYLN